MISYIATLATLLFVYMNFWFLISLVKKRNDVADIAWGLGFVLLAWSSFFIAGHGNTISLTVSSLVSVWGFRLSLHIYYRNKGKSEDYRYLEWRKQWGKWFYVRSYFQVYIFQGFLLFLIVTPILFINKSSDSSFQTINIFGFLLWAIGFYFESVGDWQLSQFIKKPENKGKLMTSGLWAYTRHPNYFGEVIQWWGFWLIALNASSVGFISIIGPLTITFLILKVSGVPMIEKKMAEHPDFAEYKKSTNVFIPMISKNVIKFFR